MATWVYPPITPEDLRKKEQESLERELQWLLEVLQDSLVSLKEGLEECVALLAPQEPGSTLVLSSLRSESVKGVVTRVGSSLRKCTSDGHPELPLSEVRQQALRRCPIYTQILSEALNIFTSNFAIRSLQDIHLRFATLPPNTARTQTNSTPSTRITINPSTPGSDLILSQLVSVKALINDSLDIIDVSRWTGQSTDASFISGQLKLLHEHLGEARACLKGPVPGQAHASSIPGGEWWTSSAAEDVFEPPLPRHLSLHFTIQDANLVLTIRTLAPISASGTPSTPTADLPFSLSGFNLRSRLLGLGTRLPTHDEMGEAFQWRGREEVTVREKLRVESGDPSLMSVAAKLSALEHEVGRWRMNVRIVMGQSGDDEDE